MSITPQPRPDWSDLLRPGCRGVRFRVLLHREGLAVANLRFQPGATIDEHDAPYDIDVMCTSGAGYFSIDGDTFSLCAGQSAVWPRGKLHRLWTGDDEMETIMLERVGA